MSKREQKNNLESWALKNLEIDIDKSKSVEDVVVVATTKLVEIRPDITEEKAQEIITEVLGNPELVLPEVESTQETKIVEVIEPTVEDEVIEPTVEDEVIEPTVEDEVKESTNKSPVKESDEYKTAMGRVLNGGKATREEWPKGKTIYATSLPTGKKQLTIAQGPIFSDATEFVPSVSDRIAKDWKVL